MKNLRTEVFENDSIRFYSQNAARYASDTMKLDMGEVYPHFLSHIAPGGKILDAGCGSGRDSLYFARQGYSVTPFDASKAMCKEASERLRFPVLQMRFEELEYDAVFDGVWACASLVHTPWAKQEPVIRKFLRALKPGGALYASWKYGNAGRVEGCRSFCDMDEARAAEILGRLGEVRLLEQWVSFGAKNTEQKWLNIILQKG